MQFIVGLMDCSQQAVTRTIGGQAVIVQPPEQIGIGLMTDSTSALDLSKDFIVGELLNKATIVRPTQRC